MKNSISHRLPIFLKKKIVLNKKETNDQVIKNRVSATSNLGERNPDLVIY